MEHNGQLKVQIKGIKEGLLITLGDGEWPSLREGLVRHIQEKQNFFKGAKVALDVGNQTLHAKEIMDLRDILSDHEVTLWAILSNSSVTEQTAKTLGLSTRLASTHPESSGKPFDTLFSGESAILVQKTLRSGYQVAHQGHIVVIGDVNPGAEVIATGSVVVWGRLRGVVHAGAEGDETAVVCALDLNPTQLRIASYVAVTPGRKGKPQPEYAYIHEGQIIAEAWKPKEGGK
jgi:septum site-determining protein MinC